MRVMNMPAQLIDTQNNKQAGVSCELYELVNEKLTHAVRLCDTDVNLTVGIRTFTSLADALNFINKALE